MKFPSFFSRALVLTLALAASQVAGAQGSSSGIKSRIPATPVTKSTPVGQSSLVPQAGHGTTHVIQYYSDNDLLPVSDEISKADLEESKWKTASEYDNLLVAERINVAQIISTPDFDNHKLPTFHGYDMVLAYMQQSLAIQEPIDLIAESAYQRVLKESVTDPVLSGMDEMVVRSLFDSLLLNLKSN